MSTSYTNGAVVLVTMSSFGLAIIVVSNGWLGNVLNHKYPFIIFSAAISTIGHSLTNSDEYNAARGHMIEGLGLGVLFCVLPAFISGPNSSLFIAAFQALSSGLLGTIFGLYTTSFVPVSAASTLGLLIALSAALLLCTTSTPPTHCSNVALPSDNRQEAFATEEQASGGRLDGTESKDNYPYDSYYYPGAKLRHLPSRSLASPEWLPMRKRLLSQYIHVQASARRLPMVQILQDHLWQGDELMDAVIAWGKCNGMSRTRRLLMQALDQGIDAVADAPTEIKELFGQLDRKPIWYSEDDYENGRVVLANASPVGRVTAVAMNIIITSLSSAVSNAVGATTQYTNPKTIMRRHLETAHFFHSITLPGGSNRFSETFKEIVKVRFMHGQVRHALKARWGHEVLLAHGNPISNSDMALGITSFGTLSLIVDSLFGRYIPISDLDSASRHWGYIAYVFGVSEDIIPQTFREGVETYDSILSSLGQPPECSAEVSDALLVIPEALLGNFDYPLLQWFLKITALPFFHGLLYHFAGNELGYRVLSARYKSQLRMKVQAIYALTVANVLVTIFTLLSSLPGQGSRMRAWASKGSRENEFAVRQFGKAAKNAGVRHITFETHDNSNVGDFKTLKVWSS